MLDAARLPFSLAHLVAFVTTTVAENRLGEFSGAIFFILKTALIQINWVILS